MSTKSNVLLIGIGPHAQKVYVPWLQATGALFSARLKAVVELTSAHAITNAFLQQYNPQPEVLYTEHSGEKLSKTLTKQLDQLAQKHDINAVIISTEPSQHKKYALWALSRGLSILMDKPITARTGAAHSPKAAKAIYEDYLELQKAYDAAKKKFPKLLFSVNVQRRYHPGFQKVLELVTAVREQTGCPVTSIESSHADGQWRTPNELADMEYHGFTHGYGKLSHSGYHFFDLIARIMSAGTPAAKLPNEVEIYSSPMHVRDNLAQITPAEYTKLFNEDVPAKSASAFEKLSATYGEIDSFSNLTFKRHGKSICHVQLSLQHTSFSTRTWVAARPDLYKGNGRVRHEQHSIQQGPLQAIHIHSYQATSAATGNQIDDFAPGGINHFEILVFRNKLLGSKTFERISITDLLQTESGVDLMTTTVKGESIQEFFTYLRDGTDRATVLSDLNTHAASAALMSDLYQAQILSKKHKAFVGQIGIS